MEEQYFLKRVKTARDRLNSKKLECIIVFGDENICYLTGFMGKDSGSILVLAQDKIYLLVHFIYGEEARNSVKTPGIEVISYIADRDEKLASIISSVKSRHAGIESNTLKYTDFTKLKNLLYRTGKKTKNLAGFVEKQREIKDQLEIKKIKSACRIINDVLKSVYELNFEKISQFTETGLSLYLESLMIKKSSPGRSFDLIVAGGKSSSLPHYVPKNNKIKPGPLLFDVGCIYENYCSDITRTVFCLEDSIKSQNKSIVEFTRIYDIVLQAQLAAVRACRAGMLSSDLDRVAREYIESKGYGRNFGHGLGHGAGLEVHEGPRVSFTSKQRLEENMVITIEPGIYIEGFGGVRIEDMVIVKKKGCEVLYDVTKNFTVID